MTDNYLHERRAFVKQEQRPTETPFEMRDIVSFGVFGLLLAAIVAILAGG